MDTALGPSPSRTIDLWCCAGDHRRKIGIEILSDETPLCAELERWRADRAQNAKSSSNLGGRSWPLVHEGRSRIRTRRGAMTRHRGTTQKEPGFLVRKSRKEVEYEWLFIMRRGHPKCWIVLSRTCANDLTRILPDSPKLHN